MESIKTFVRGLLLGAGFAVGAILIYTWYRFFLEAPSQMEFRDRLVSEVEQQAGTLSAQLIDFKTANSRAFVTVKIINQGKKPMIYVAPKVDFFDGSNKFLSDCFGKPRQLLKAGEEVFFAVECRLPELGKAAQATSAKVVPILDLR